MENSHILFVSLNRVMMKYQARKKLLLISGSLLIGSVSGHAIATVVAHQNSDKPTINAQQKTPTKWGIFNVECGLSHTLPDDPMMAFGLPGESMVHDFYGNKETDAFTTVGDLHATPETTCTSRADSSAYWSPQMLNTSTGEIIKPSMMKTYYRNTDIRYPVVPFPAGLQLMIGEHESTRSKPGVSYLCHINKNGGTYYNDPPASCPLYDGENTLFSLSFSFPNCWDGKNIKPPHHGPRNAVHDINGVCPSDYPVKIPQLQMNIGYHLPKNTDISALKLSMNPEMVKGQAIPKWGSLYTAHADFFNGWKEDAIEYVVDNCLNQERKCDKNIPFTAFPTSADSYVRGGDYATSRFGDADSMLIKKGKGQSPEQQKVAYLKFNVPDKSVVEDLPYKDIYIHFYGANVASKEQHMLYFYETSNDWDEYGITQENTPSCSGKWVARSWMGWSGNAMYRNSESIANVVKAAWEKGQSEISFCVNTDDKNIETRLGSQEGSKPAFLYFESKQDMTSPGWNEDKQ
ncbi:DUF1996 domain-containing protein [Yersinia ruckeri]|uniref:DUF1996 domain-containing protein n=3 Tax=Yersinia ruckeri TaxID=29486 RepID=UPI001FE036E8|nr:DUF1996 domain-containing protein [Yersinia ruckeri]